MKHNRGKFIKFGLCCVVLSGVTALSVLALNAGRVEAVNHIEQVVNQDTLPEKVAKIKNEIVYQIKGCETQGKSEADGVIVLDTNNQMSIGLWQFQIKTVIYFYKTLYGKEITRKEAVEVALDEEQASKLVEDILFKTENSSREWFNCSNKLNLQAQIDTIKKLEK